MNIQSMTVHVQSLSSNVKITLPGSPASATTFQNSNYIKALNATLQREVGLKRAYRSCKKRKKMAPVRDQSMEQHANASKALQKIIIRQSSVPNIDSDMTSYLMEQWLNFTESLPEIIAGPTTIKSISLLENKLIEQYQQVLKLAPRKDYWAVSDLKKEAEKSLLRLQEI